MGRKRQAKHWRTILAEAERHERDAAKDPCETCAFRDSECWITDKAIGQKLLTCLKNHDWFFCHHGLELVDRQYQEPRRPDGTPDRAKMTPCGGFVRWRYRVKALSQAEQEREVMKLQRHFLTRYLASDMIGVQRFQEMEITPSDLQEAINYSLYMNGMTGEVQEN